MSPGCHSVACLSLCRLFWVWWIRIHCSNIYYNCNIVCLMNMHRTINWYLRVWFSSAIRFVDISLILQVKAIWNWITRITTKVFLQQNYASLNVKYCFEICHRQIRKHKYSLKTLFDICISIYNVGPDIMQL